MIRRVSTSRYHLELSGPSVLFYSAMIRYIACFRYIWVFRGVLALVSLGRSLYGYLHLIYGATVILLFVL